MKVFILELRKAFINRWFVIALCVGLVLATISAYGVVFLYMETERMMLEWWGVTNPFLSVSSCYRFFMTSDYTQASTDLFYALLPLLAVLPYGWSLCQEKQSGYLQNIYVRVERTRYLGCKACAAALSGGTVVLAPLLLNCIICACFIPAYTPDVVSVFHTGIYESVMGSQLYYQSPLLFVGLYLILSFLFSGVWSAFVVLIGGFAKDSVRLLAGSFLVLYLLAALEYKFGILFSGSGTEYLSLSPLVWLRGVSFGGYTEIGVAVVWLLVLMLFVVICICCHRKEDML